MNQEMVRTNRERRLLSAYTAPVLISLAAIVLSLVVYPMGAIIMRNAIKDWHNPPTASLLAAIKYGIVFFVCGKVSRP